MAGIKDECIITSCGYISREVYYVKDRPRNFYMLGSMGCELGLGLGLAYTRPDLEIIVISGDGSALMNLGSTCLNRKLMLKNFRHYVVDNGHYASTGGQPTCGFPHIFADEVFPAGLKSNAPRIPLTCKQIKERFYESIRLRN